ncbi:hypothetical protein CDEF62S_00910 [Castellaniella defragrans]
MCSSSHPVALEASTVAPRAKSSNYPEPFYSRMAKRENARSAPRLSLSISAST